MAKHCNRNNSQSKSMFTPLQFLQSGIIDHLGSHWCFSKPGTGIVFVHFNAFKWMTFFRSNPTIQTVYRFFVILHQWHQFLFTGRDTIVLVISDKRLGSTELALWRFALCVHLEITQRRFELCAYLTVRGLTATWASSLLSKWSSHSAGDFRFHLHLAT